MKKIRLVVNSLPGSAVSSLGLDALVLVDCDDHSVVHALGMCPVPCSPFAKTAGECGYDIISCAGGDVPTEHYAVYARGEVMTEDHVAEVLAALDGLGVLRVGFYIGNFPHNEFDVGPFVRKIARWLNDRRHGIENVFVLSQSPATTYVVPPEVAAEYPNVKFASPEYGANIVNDVIWFFSRLPDGKAKITSVACVGDHEYLGPELQIPETVDAAGEHLSVTEIDSLAFECFHLDGGRWRDEVRSVIIPRYVVHADATRIARSFPDLEEVCTDSHNCHLATRNREWNNQR